MFVAHRSTLFGELRVQRFERQEIDDVRTIISSQGRKRDTFLDDELDDGNILDEYTQEVLGIFDDIIDEILEDPMTDLTCFTIRCGQSKKHTDCPLVGFLILRWY